jgi:TIGR03009 family protein
MRIFATRLSIASFILCLAVGRPGAAQQQIRPLQPAVQPLPQPLAQAPAPDGFALNQLQEAMLDNVLNAWQLESAKINTFKCSFERWEYNAFSPKVNNEVAPLNKCSGELSYNRPDKGSFQITEVRAFKTTPPAAGQAPDAPVTGDWVKQPEAIGEHWVCDGKSIFEYRHQDKHLVERPIPKELQGQAIVDGPLPFLFGAEAKKLKARYWMRIEDQDNKDAIYLTALPKFQAQAADYSKVEVILDRKQLLPKAMQVTMPDNSRHMYMFDIANAAVNSRLAIFATLFQRPRVWPGWKHVVEQAPMSQAAQPVPAPK